jgi:hypothetical protein
MMLIITTTASITCDSCWGAGHHGHGLGRRRLQRHKSDNKRKFVINATCDAQCSGIAALTWLRCSMSNCDMKSASQ